MFFSGLEVLFKTCVAMKFVDDDDDGIKYGMDRTAERYVIGL